MRVYASLYGCAQSPQGVSDSFSGKSQFIWYHLPTPDTRPVHTFRRLHFPGCDRPGEDDTFSMTSLALALVLTSAILHAFWNLSTKRINGGVEAVWLFTAVSAVVFAPIAVFVWVLERPHIGPIQLVFLAGSGVLQMIYFRMLSRGYQVGELSVVYPLARGTGPLLATGLAIVLLGEDPKALTIAGAVLICVGVFLIATSGRRRSGGVPKSAIIYGIGTGLVIGSYTVWDGHAVSALEISVILQAWVSDAARALYLAPYARRRSTRLLELWSMHRRDIVTVGILSSVSCMLVLTAMSFSPVSSMAPAREVSILFGAIMGIVVLKEPLRPVRLVAAGIIVAGVIAVAIG